jgi:hypothetical protein
MSITQIITQLSGTAAERRSQLAEIVTAPSGRGRLTNSAFGDLTTPEAANQLFQILKASAESYSIQYVVQGIDTSTDDWKERVDGIDATSIPGLAALKPIIRDWEIAQVTRWESLGGSGEIPNVETIQSIMDAAATKAWWAAKSAVVDEGLHELTITSKAQVRDVIGGD